MFFRICDGRTHVRTPPTFRGKSETAAVRCKNNKREWWEKRENKERRTRQWMCENFQVLKHAGIRGLKTHWIARKMHLKFESGLGKIDENATTTEKT
jgi:hypothetical protein